MFEHRNLLPRFLSGQSTLTIDMKQIIGRKLRPGHHFYESLLCSEPLRGTCQVFRPPDLRPQRQQLTRPLLTSLTFLKFTPVRVGIARLSRTNTRHYDPQELLIYTVLLIFHNSSLIFAEPA